MEVSQKGFKAKIIYTMIRVSDLDRSVAFYTDVLGMSVFRREEYPEGRFTLVFVGYGDESSNSTIELTFNWDENEYQHGTAYGHLALGVDDIYAACDHLKSNGVNITRAPGPMAFTATNGVCDVIAFIQDPDGYKIEIIENHK
ncbi:MAG: lactoylglutathione lyase [Arenicella sp.]|nr:lactoylglutathione lyase [Arenicella sp.]